MDIRNVLNFEQNKLCQIFPGKNAEFGRTREYSERGRHVQSDDRLNHGRRLRKVRRQGRQRAGKRLPFRFGRRRRYNIFVNHSFILIFRTQHTRQYFKLPANRTYIY